MPGAPPLGDATPWFVRPPIWKYNEAVLGVYDELHLKMILTDSLLHDGGYSWQGGTFESWLMWIVEDAIEEGQAELVLTMHDSNRATARDLPAILAHIRAQMAEWGYTEGQHWDFVKDTNELLDILCEKRTFHSKPDLTLQDVSEGWRNHDQ